MEYSKDIIIGLNYLDREDKSEKNKILQFMNKHKLLASVGFTCAILMFLDGILIYNFIELFQKL